jgi:alkaline phosphatase
MKFDWGTFFNPSKKSGSSSSTKVSAPVAGKKASSTSTKSAPTKITSTPAKNGGVVIADDYGRANPAPEMIVDESADFWSFAKKLGKK